MKDNMYLGPGCRHGHHNEDGKSIRYKATTRCIECQRIEGSKKRISAEVKAYQREYHMNLRKNHPEKIEQYCAQQVKNGTRVLAKKPRKPKDTV